jgi:spore maturation protein CgeB
MRIFYASDTTPMPEFDFKSNIWRNNLLMALVDLGHDVVEFDYDLTETFQNLDDLNPTKKAFIDVNRPRVTEELCRQVKAAHTVKPVDLFFSYFYDACVLPEGIDEMRSMNIVTANWYCNGSNLLRLVSEISPHYDWCLVPEKFRMDDYVAMGARPIYSQEAANPKFYKPYDLSYEYDVTFVGQVYGERPKVVKYLRSEGIDVRVWGQKWNHYVPSGDFPAEVAGSPLPDQEMVKMYNRSRINLGFSAVWQEEETDERILQVRLRDFEVPMSGGFYIVEYIEELEEFYKIGNEIVCYTSQEDLADKIRYYLDHEEERESIRRAGRERCLRDHTWQKRFETAFKKMGL